MDGNFPDDVRRLLATQIHSVVELEMLLFLRQNSGREWAADELADKLEIDSPAADRTLFDLMARGFLAATRVAPVCYRYSPKTSELGRTVDRLADLYARRRLAVTDLISRQPSESLRLFSDAFRFWRKEEG